MDEKLKKALYILERYNGIFRQIYDLGRIHFTDDEQIPTACVAFDKETGDSLKFIFNKKFYDSLSTYELAFVIAHECMHPLLYHGRRMFKNPVLAKNTKAANIAADIALHEIMIREFGFDESQITIDKCTVESVFKEHAHKIKRDSTLEYYFNELRNYDISQYYQLDVHNFSPEDAERLENIVEKAFNKLTNTEKKELIDKLKDAKQASAGTESGGHWYDVNINPVVKQKWEMVIKKWALPFLVNDQFEWCRKNRRMQSFERFMSSSGRKIFIPSDKDKEIKKTTVKLFMDTSGSCINLADRFFSAAASLPPKIFSPELYCFDTKVYKTNIKDKGVYGGGGTAFDIIEEELLKSTYPDFVFVITDGYGNNVNPKYPERWNIFLTSDYKDCFPDKCVFHSFNEFE